MTEQQRSVDLLSGEGKFNLWFRKVVEEVWDDDDAGFVLLMVALPLLERYGRRKAGLSENDRLNNDFHGVFSRHFSIDLSAWKAFWHIFRNGFLHQATLNKESKCGQYVGFMQSWDGGMAFKIEQQDQKKAVYVYPREFVRSTFELIEGDYTTFTGGGSSGPEIARVYGGASPSQTAAQLPEGTGFSPPGGLTGSNEPTS